jgi:hypothetical protein
MHLVIKYVRVIQNIYIRNVLLLILSCMVLSCVKWPHEVDCFCLVDTVILSTNDHVICADAGGEIIQCSIHDLIKYNEQRD